MADIISLDHIDVTFPQKKGEPVRAVSDVNLHVEKGDIYGVVGYSGAGKSPLVRTINLLQKPTEGTVTVGGTVLFKDHAQQVSNAELQAMRRNIGMIFQHFNLLNETTVVDNVLFALKHAKLKDKEAQEKALNLLELVGLKDKAQAFPVQLSGGEQQRVAIARALANDPEILISDEATSALDPRTTNQILDLLRDFNKKLGLTIVLITHEMDVVKRICDCVAVISNGELIEQDTVSEVFSHPKTPLAQKFIQSTLHLDIPEDYQERLQAEPFTDCVPMLRLEFTGQSVDAPLLSETARRFNVNNNIISAQMDYAGGVKFGIMLTEMHGTQQDTQAAIAWLQEHHVKVEVLGYV